MTPQDDKHPTQELLPVTEDMLLTEEELERLLGESPAAFELSQAVLRSDEMPPATVPAVEDFTLPEAGDAPVQTAAHNRRTGTRANAKRRRARSSGARWAFVAVALLCVAGAGVWLTLPPHPASTAKKEGAAEVLAGAASITPADAAAILAADSFDYPDKSELKGQAGGPGWAGPWNAAKATIAPKSLTTSQTAPGGAGGHVSIAAPEQITLTRPYAPSVAVPDPKTGGEWWVSLVVSHTGGGAGDGGELWINFFSATNINSVIRLTLTEKGHALQLHGPGGSKPVSVPGTPGAAVRLLARIQSNPAAGGKFDFLMDVWINPAKADALPKPDLSLSAKGAAVPGKPGFSFQKLLQKTPGMTRLDGVSIARTAAAAMK